MSEGINLPVCEIRSGEIGRIGFLYIKNERVIVLLNNVAAVADLGPMQSVRNRHIVPEADIFVIPTEDVTEIIQYEKDTE